MTSNPLQPHTLAPPYSAPRGSSSTAILAVVFGAIALAIGWVPICGSLPALGFALVGIPLGCVAFAAARRPSGGGRGLPIAGLILCSLGLLLAAATTIAPIVAVAKIGQAVMAEVEAENQRRIDAERSPAPFRDAAVYFVRSDSHFAGTGFIIDTGAGLHAITAEHPFDGELPRTFLSLEPATEINLGERTWRGDDVQALALAPDAAPAASALHYPGPMTLRQGDRVAIITRDGPAYATVTHPGHILSGLATLDVPRKATGLSGAPIVLETTGTVVGVLVGADDTDRATLVEFKRLRLPAPTGRDALPAR